MICRGVCVHPSPWCMSGPPSPLFLVLQLAVRLMSPFGQSVAIGNLGITHQHAGDTETAKACWDQHLLLARGLRDKVAEAKAALRLGCVGHLL